LSTTSKAHFVARIDRLDIASLPSRGQGASQTEYRARLSVLADRFPPFFDQRSNSVQICTVTTSRGRAQTLIPSPIGHRLLIALSRDTIDLAGHLRFD
jgi:hypothetical protein